MHEECAPFQYVAIIHVTCDAHVARHLISDHVMMNTTMASQRTMIAKS